ncbi:MAG TPA: hypothetical protein VF400_00935, partial [Anaeromyxobacteraceae bacterium]
RGHAEFLLEYDEAAAGEDEVKLVEKRLMQGVRGGFKHAAGQPVGLGVITGELSAEDGLLLVSEPDMVAFPIRYVRGVTRAAQYLAAQKPVLDSLEKAAGLVPDYPSILDSALVCKRLGEGLGILERAEKGTRDTGWFAGCRDPKHDHNDPGQLERISVYELLRRRPECVPYLPLWVGCKIVLTGKAPLIIADAKLGLKLKAGSPLAQAGARVESR